MYERVTGLGWSEVLQSPSPLEWWWGTIPQEKLCLERTGGGQRCFAESESEIAINNDCERTSESCSGGNVWCCPGGAPQASSTTMNPGYVAPSHRIPGVLLIVVAGAMAAVGWFVFSRVRAQRSVAPALARHV